jgi:hypothetical protein
MNPVFGATTYPPPSQQPPQAATSVLGAPARRGAAPMVGDHVHFGSSLLGTLGNEASQLRFLIFNPLSPLRPETLATVNFLQIALPLAGLAYLVYTQGLENQRHQHDPNLWAKQIGMGALNTVLSLNVPGVFPIVNGMLGVYKASREHNMDEQVKAGVQTASTAATGFIGAYLLGKGLEEAYWALDLKRLREFQNSPYYNSVMRQLGAYKNPPEVKALPGTIKALFKALDQYNAEYTKVKAALEVKTVPDTKLLGELRKSLGKHITATSEKLSVALEKIMATEGRRDLRGVIPKFEELVHLNNFKKVVERSTALDVQLSKWLGPTFAFILCSALIGGPLAQGIMKLVHKVAPGLVQKDIRQTPFSEFFEQREKEAHFAHRSAGHGGGGHETGIAQYWEPPNAFDVADLYTPRGVH